VSVRRSSAFVLTIAVLVTLAALALVPTPFYLISPGSAVDLTKRIAVEGRVPTQRHFFLTDVSVRRATVLWLAAGLWPGTRIVRRDTLIPPGTTQHEFDRLLSAAMDDSQHVAAYVAERAAGLHVPAPAPVVLVADLVPNSPATGLLRIGDRLVRVGQHPVLAPSDVSSAVTRLEPGTRAHIDLERDGRPASVDVPTMRTDRGARLGIYVRARGVPVTLPIPVHFTLDDVEGSSGGLMFALAIYAELTNDRHPAESIAGTGTIALDGSVGPIEGAPQKLIAAKRAGATVFLVPRQNYRDIAGDSGITVVPVATFSEALAALR
jgi:PDZ domain-containing protein